MKTPDQIKADIEQVHKEAEKLEANAVLDKGQKEKERMKLRNRLGFYRKALGYVVSNPNPDFVKRMRSAVIESQRRIEKNYEKFYDPKAKDAEENRRSYYTQENYAMYSSQLKMLNYILGPFTEAKK